MDRERLVAQLREELKATEAYAKGLRKALEALDPEQGALRAKPSKPKAKPPAKGTQVSEGFIDNIAQVLAEQGQPVTVGDMAGLTGRSHGAVRTALETLREREQVRYVGKRPAHGDGSGTPSRLYMPMGAGVVLPAELNGTGHGR